MTDEHACETPISDHVRSALAKMESGEWFLTLTHPEPSQGSAHYGTDVAVALASALAPSPSMREAVEALREDLRKTMVRQHTTGTRYTYSDGFQQGLALAIGKIDAALNSLTGAKP